MKRGTKKLLIYLVVGVCLVVFIVIPILALTGLYVTEQRARLARPPETRVPALKGLDPKTAEEKLKNSKLNIRVLATRWDLDAPPGVVVDQSPMAGETVAVGHTVGVTVSVPDPNARR